MEVNTKVKMPRADYSGAYILVDDVTTEGGTLKGARIVLQSAVSKSTIIMLVLGLSQAPSKFQPIQP